MSGEKRVIRFGRTSFLNAWPLDIGLCLSLRELVLERVVGVPSRLNRLMERGRLDLSLLSTVELLRFPGRYRVLGGAAVGSRGPVGSVLLFGRVPPGEMGGKTVLLPRDSSTSVALLRLLFRRFWKVEPVFSLFPGPPRLEPMLARGEGALLIGDEALRASLHQPHLVQADLGGVWYGWTGKPFVYAVFVLRRELEREMPSLAKELEGHLAGAAERGMGALRPFFPVLARRFGISPRDLEEYLTLRVSYRFGVEERQGLALFFRFLKEEQLVVPAVAAG